MTPASHATATTLPGSSRISAKPSALATRTMLACAILAGPIFLTVGIVQGLGREGFDFTRNAISQLSLGALGWIQVINFLLTGILAIVGAIGIRRTLGTMPGGTWAPRLIGVFGASFLAAAVFRADPGAGFPAGAAEAPATSLSTHGALHMFSALVGYVALCAAFIVLARYFSVQRQRWWAMACRLVPAGVLIGFAGSSATVLAFTFAAALGLAWLTAVAARLLTADDRSRSARANR